MKEIVITLWTVHIKAVQTINKLILKTLLWGK